MPRKKTSESENLTNPPAKDEYSLKRPLNCKVCRAYHEEERKRGKGFISVACYACWKETGDRIPLYLHTKEQCTAYYARHPELPRE